MEELQEKPCKCGHIVAACGACGQGYAQVAVSEASMPVQVAQPAESKKATYVSRKLGPKMSDAADPPKKIKTAIALRQMENETTHSKLKDEEGKCKICEENACICTCEIKNLFNHEEAFYTTATGEKEPWVRVIQKEQRLFMGCYLCLTFLGNGGVKSAPGNCQIHHGRMLVTKKISLDTLKGHLGYEPDRASLNCCSTENMTSCF